MFSNLRFFYVIHVHEKQYLSSIVLLNHRISHTFEWESFLVQQTINDTMETNSPSVSKISPCLFLDEEGEPLQFAVCGNDKTFKTTIEKIQEGNGVLNTRRNGPYTIPLDLPTSVVFTENEVFSIEFISDSCKEGVLQDLNKYRLKKDSIYAKDFNFNKVMLKMIPWNDVPLASSITDPDDEFEKLNHKDMMRTVSRPYSEKERLAIINYIVEHEAYSCVGGDRLWMEMEESKKFEGRTWQSLKNHFKRKIFPQIKSYKLSEDIKKRFIKRS